MQPCPQHARSLAPAHASTDQPSGPHAAEVDARWRPRSSYHDGSRTRSTSCASADGRCPRERGPRRSCPLSRCTFVVEARPAPEEDMMRYLLQIYSDLGPAEFRRLSAAEQDAILGEYRA